MTHPFYNSTAWKKTRGLVRQRDGEACVVCGAGIGLDVDHIVPWAQRPDLALDPSNLQTLCRLHHNRKRMHRPPKPTPQRRNSRRW